MENTYKCKYCDKTFKRESNKIKHETQYCKFNPIKIEEADAEEKKIEQILEEVVIVESLDTLEDTQEPIYTENELYLLKIFKNFNPANIEVRLDIRNKLMKIYLDDYNRKVDCDCASQYVRMYMFLYTQKNNILNR